MMLYHWGFETMVNLDDYEKKPKSKEEINVNQIFNRMLDQMQSEYVNREHELRDRLRKSEHEREELESYYRDALDRKERELQVLRRLLNGEAG